MSLAVLALVGCGGGETPGSPAKTSAIVRGAPRGPAFGLTENNADLLWPPGAPAPSGGAAFEPAREQLTALHPRYLRLLVDWAKLQPDRSSAPALNARLDGCARGIAPCGPYAGLREDLAAIASQQRAARAQGRDGFEVVLDVFGAPAWAALPASGCELAGTQPFSRPASAAGLDGYRALVRSLLQLGSRMGVQLPWWSPWNEPNDPVFVSPQRAACAPTSPSLAPGEYAQLAQAMAGQLRADGGVHHLLLGELNAFEQDSPHRTSIATFVAALPDDVICLGDTWAIHAYAARGQSAPAFDPVAELERALDARGECGRRAGVWVSEAGAGAPHPGLARPAGAQDESAGCEALAAQVDRWAADPRVQALLQYSFREDPAFPVGLLNAPLTHVYPAYRLWHSYTRASERGEAPPPPSVMCA